MLVVKPHWKYCLPQTRPYLLQRSRVPELNHPSPVGTTCLMAIEDDSLIIR
jgi:hypothetical protein